MAGLSVRRIAVRPATLALGLLALALSPVGQAADGVRWAGRVVRVTDGDTVWVQPHRDTSKPVKVRLAEMDAPERCQPGGPEATRALRDRVMHRDVTVEAVAEDDYGRTVARLWDGRQDVAAGLVAAGWAWNGHYRGQEGPYASQEQSARAARRGVFAKPGAETPRQFRQRVGPCPLR